MKHYLILLFALLYVNQGFSQVRPTFSIGINPISPYADISIGLKHKKWDFSAGINGAYDESNVGSTGQPLAYESYYTTIGYEIYDSGRQDWHLHCGLAKVKTTHVDFRLTTDEFFGSRFTSIEKYYVYGDELGGLVKLDYNFWKSKYFSWGLTAQAILSSSHLLPEIGVTMQIGDGYKKK